MKPAFKAILTVGEGFNSCSVAYLEDGEYRQDAIPSTNGYGGRSGWGGAVSCAKPISD